MDLLLRLKRCRARVLLCGYAHPTYDLLLSDWARLETKTRCRVGMHDPRTEVLWRNYEPSKPGKEAA